MEATAVRMTMDEMKERFPGKWVVLDELEDDPAESPKVRSGRVRGAFSTRDEAWECADRLDIADGAVFGMGGPVTGALFVL